MYPDEAKLKQMAYEQQAKCAEAPTTGYADCGQASTGSLGNTVTPRVRSRFRERISESREHSERHSRKAVLYEELEFLMDKYPDIARMIELMEEIGR
jgi:hypothetical protein